MYDLFEARQDRESVAEAELMAKLIVAASEVGWLSQREIDHILGVPVGEGAARGPGAPARAAL